MQTFVPYANVISIAQFAGDQLAKNVVLNHCYFEAKESNLNASQDVFIKTAHRLNERQKRQPT